MPALIAAIMQRQFPKRETSHDRSSDRPPGRAVSPRSIFPQLCSPGWLPAISNVPQTPSTMDPASAIGVAAASLQFLEFAVKATRATREICRSASGLTQRQESLCEIADRLTDLAEQQQESIDEYALDHEATRADKKLHEICVEC